MSMSIVSTVNGGTEWRPISMPSGGDGDPSKKRRLMNALQAVGIGNALVAERLAAFRPLLLPFEHFPNFGF